MMTPTLSHSPHSIHPHYDVVAAVVTDGHYILCVKKGKTRYSYTSYKYEFPGGKVEAGETPEEALRRELMEEMHYAVTVGRHLVTVTHDYPDFSITLHAYMCTAQDPQSYVLSEHVEACWLTADELYALDWAAADRDIVAYLANNRES